MHRFWTKSPAELIFSAVLLYNFRLFERHYGSAKFASFALTAEAFSTLLQLALLSQHSALYIDSLPSGPYVATLATRGRRPQL